MKLRAVRKASCDTRVHLVYADKAGSIADFSADAGEVAVRYEGDRTLVYAGLGDSNSSSDQAVRAAAAGAVRALTALKRPRASLVLTGVRHDHAAAAEGALLADYAFDKYLGENAFHMRTLECVSRRLTPATLRRVTAICDGVCYARDLVNDNAETVTPAYLAAQARSIGRRAGMQVRVLTERDLKKEGLGLLAAVGRGSPTAPRLIIMTYRGAPSSKDVTAIAGKGITFDAGGLNLKPSGHIETMRMDMAGAATVLGVMKALGETRPKVNVVGVCAAAHNSIDGGAYIPGDVIRSYSGKTVEICNTDAEGRLALGDALAYVIKKHSPARVIDLATLTGGILIAFADVLCGLFSNDDALAGDLFAAGEKTHERMWRLPMYDEFRDAMKGDRSDLRNLGKFKRGHASSITGAAFIEAFVGTTPWAHLDIAGTAYNEGEPRGEKPRHATGFGVRLLMHYLQQKAAAGSSAGRRGRKA